jgi:hypothetical protein
MDNAAYLWGYSKKIKQSLFADIVLKRGTKCDRLRDVRGIRAPICSADDNHVSLLHAGLISLSEWCTAMEDQTRLGIPWRMLREKLVIVEPSSGKVEYNSTFQDHTNGRRSVRHHMLQVFYYFPHFLF